jgi:NAD(P)-dependent dehydrogenase (short-subunit alcohol dehydrogenase family)
MSNNTSKDQTAMQNPAEQNPKPPFDTPMQPEPGLAADMQPQPDHGEDSYKGTGRLQGRKALVTGGDSGIGRAAAIAFAREGADVVITYLPQEQTDADQVMEVLRATGVKTAAIPGDLTDESFCKQLVEQTVQELGGLDILANVAGKQITQESITDISTQQFEQTFTVNVYAMFWLCKYALPHLAEGASIINTTSIQAYQPSPSLLDYAPTKAAIKAFTQGLAKQVADKGIRVNAVAPGPIWTPLQPSQGQPPEKLHEFGAETPLKRPGQPVEVAPAYVFFASQESSYVTGEVLGVTGGNHTT